MHGLSGSKKWIQRRHMWRVQARSTTVASSTPDSFFKDGSKICVGDCALFKPPQDSPPLIGIIRRLIVDKQYILKLGVNWLYRPADIELGKGCLLEAAPNEVFYSFHKDEIPAGSLLHPCKVSFLHKGVELPSGVSSFVCRRVYDTEDKCLCWLTDKDYNKVRQEEVDKLLNKTQLEMHGAVQSGSRSPKPSNGSPSRQQLKSGSDSMQNNTSSFSSQSKGKKRERGDQGFDSVKREHVSKTEDDILKSEISKITDKGGLVDMEGVEKFVQLMQSHSAEKKLDLSGRKMLVDVIAVTDRYDCLEHFVQLRGLPVMDEWLHEVHKGKVGDSGSPKENDKAVEEFLLALLRALDKLPVNLHALQTCNVGKSVNHLRGTHKNSEIQKKARSLVDTWKKRVEAEMNMNDAKSGPGRSVSWPTKQVSSEVPNVNNRKTAGYTEAAPKVSVSHPSASKTSQVKLGSGDLAVKSSLSPCSTKPVPVSACGNSKDSNFRTLTTGGSSDLPLTPIKVERSSSSSQSQNNSQSCSSDHAKAMGSSCRSTAGSVSVNKISSGSSRHRKSSNGIPGSIVVQKETRSAKLSASNRNSSSEKASSTGITHENSLDVPHADNVNSQRLIVRLPNTGRSPVTGGGRGSFEDPGGTTGGRENTEKHDTKLKGKSDIYRVSPVSNMKAEVCHGKDGLPVSDDGNGSPHCDELRGDGEEGGDKLEVSKVTSSSLGMGLGKPCGASLSSMNALIESCAKFSEASVSASPRDERGMNLLASVATGEICKSENVSPSVSPVRSSPAPEESCSGNSGKLRHSGEEVAQAQCNTSGPDVGTTNVQGDTFGSSEGKNEVRNTAGPLSPSISRDQKGTSFYLEEKSGECNVQLNSSLTNSHKKADDPCSRSDAKPGELTFDVSVALPSIHVNKEGRTDAGDSILSQEQRRSEAHQVMNSTVSDPKLKRGILLSSEDNKLEQTDGRTPESSAAVGGDATASTVIVAKEINDKSPDSSSEKVGEYKNVVDKESGSGILTEQKQSLVAETHLQSLSGKVKGADVHSVESKAENAIDMKAGGHGFQSGSHLMDLGSSDSPNSIKKNECPENLEKSDCLRFSGGPVSHVESSLVPLQDKEPCENALGQKLNVVVPEVTGEQNAAGGNAPLSGAGSDMAVKLDFDLNEGFPSDDVCQGEQVKLPVTGTSSSAHFPCPLPFPISPMSGSFPASITVAAAVKGPFLPPESPLRTKGELGWKGSAATSAFRPAEPRKYMEISLNTDAHVVDTPSSKPGRPALDFDLNVPDERVLEDVASRSSAQATCSESGSLDRGAGGLDLDLNRVDESPDVSPFAVSNSFGLEIPSLPSWPSSTGRVSNGGVNISRGFDLNNGPGPDEVCTEAAPRSQHGKSSLPFQVPNPGVRINSTEFGNFSSWFPPANAYPAITVPSILTGRGDQSYVAASGSQRFMGPTGNTAFAPELYRGPVLSSTPAVAFQSPAPFQYPGGFPFETSFPLSSNSFSSSTAYMDSSSGGAVCYPAIPSQLVGPAGVVSSPYTHPFVMNLQGGTSESRKWGNQGLDLNAGPRTDTERRDPLARRQVSHPVPQALAEEQLKMFQMAGNVLKRKEPDSGWDAAADRFSYKQQPSWQ